MPKATQGRDTVNLSRPKKAKHDDAEGKPGGVSGKDLAKGVQGMVNVRKHANLLVVVVSS
jgi:hypothetical protein